MFCVKNISKSGKRKIIHSLAENTYFTESELYEWYDGFMKDYPSGTLDREEFALICQQIFPYGDATHFSQFFFHLFDRNGDGVIDFDEFITTLSPISRGSLDEKIRWTFRLYDQDNDGFVTKDDMANIVGSIYRMVDNVVKLPLEENTAEKRVEKMFMLMDKNEDSVLSLDEFVDGCKADGKILQILSCYNKDFT